MKKVLPFSLFLFFSVIGYCQIINFSGTISSNTTWSADTVKITGDIFVNNGVTLTISAGTYIEFQSYYDIQVSGRILSIGNSNDSITFTIKDTTGFADNSNYLGGWKNILLIGTPSISDSSVFKYCKFSYSKYTAILSYNTRPVKIENCLFSNNIGAIGIENNIHFLIKNNYFRKNRIALIAEYSNPIISENIFQNNESAILANGSSPLITNNIISHCNGIGIDIVDYGSDTVSITQNEITYNANGITIIQSSNSNELSNILINQNIITHNFNVAQPGSGIFISESSPTTIINNTIAYNSSLGGSGIYIGNNSSPLIIFNKICNNRATGFGCGVQDSGAGILSVESSPSIINNLICNNESEYAGGGISIIDNFLVTTIVSNTIVNNRSNQSWGGGISISMGGDAILKNNIIFGNSACQTYGGGSDQIFANNDGSGNFFDISYCDFSDTINVSGYYSAHYDNLILANPLFVNPTSGSGINYDALTADWSLLQTSPCYNAGTPDTTGLYLSGTDITGNSRVKFGRIDMGAYEYSGEMATVANLSNPEAIFIFPNPTRDNLFIQSNEKIKNMKCINYIGQAFDLKLENNSINTSSLSQGAYFLNITTLSGKTVIKRFIKE